MFPGKEEPGLTREEIQEQERLRKEAILLAERERHKKYRKQDEEREVVRQKIREKVRFQKYSADIYCQDLYFVLQYNIEKPVTEDDDDEDDDDDYTFGPKKTVEKDDAIVSK